MRWFDSFDDPDTTVFNIFLVLIFLQKRGIQIGTQISIINSFIRKRIFKSFLMNAEIGIEQIHSVCVVFCPASVVLDARNTFWYAKIPKHI